MRIKESSGSSICSHREMSDYLTVKINSDRADNGAPGPENPAAGEIAAEILWLECGRLELIRSGFYSKLSLGLCHTSQKVILTSYIFLHSYLKCRSDWQQIKIYIY